MRQLTFEIPIGEISETKFLTEPLKKAQIIQFLRLDHKGFLLICRVKPEWSDSVKKSLANADRSHGIRVKILNTERSGAEILQVSGKWPLGGGRNGNTQNDCAATSQTVIFFRSLERAPIYTLRNPSFDGRMLKFSLVADQKMIKYMLDGLDRVKIPYKVAKLGHPAVGDGSGSSILEDLTLKQASILKLAHTMGYYEVPKKTRTADLARLLGMDKGTVSDHLRRAEKHIINRLIQN